MDWWQKWICDMCMRDQVKSRAVPGLSDICLMGDLFGVVPYTCCRTWSDLSTLFLVFQDMILATVGMQSSYHGHYGCNGIMVLLDHYAVFEVRKHWQRKLDCVIVTWCVKIVGFRPEIFNASKNPLPFCVHLQSMSWNNDSLQMVLVTKRGQTWRTESVYTCMECTLVLDQ